MPMRRSLGRRRGVPAVETTVVADQDAPRIRDLIEAGDLPQQRRLAATGSAEDGDEFAVRLTSRETSS